MRAFWTLLVLLLALVVQSALSDLAPGQARMFDPFLLVVVYCGLLGGETHGMLAGAVAGWIQDIHFGGSVHGLSALTKILIGFGVGLSGSRFLLVAPGPRFLVLFCATLLDGLLFERLAGAFEVALNELSILGLLTRATANALIGLVLFEVVDRRRRGEARP